MQIRNPGAPCDNGRGRFASFCFASEYLIPSRKEFSAAVVATGPQIVVTSADRVAFLELGRRLVGKPVGDGAVRVVPAIVVAGSDVPGDGDDLAEESAALFGRAKQSDARQMPRCARIWTAVLNRLRSQQCLMRCCLRCRDRRQEEFQFRGRCPSPGGNAPRHQRQAAACRRLYPRREGGRTR
jgi:hypothetical protein